MSVNTEVKRFHTPKQLVGADIQLYGKRCIITPKDWQGQPIEAPRTEPQTDAAQNSSVTFDVPALGTVKRASFAQDSIELKLNDNATVHISNKVVFDGRVTVSPLRQDWWQCEIESVMPHSPTWYNDTRTELRDCKCFLVFRVKEFHASDVIVLNDRVKVENTLVTTVTAAERRHIDGLLEWQAFRRRRNKQKLVAFRVDA